MLYMTLGSKGGIGKSSISALLAEYLIDQNKEVLPIDLDAENASFSEYKSLNATWINTRNHKTKDIDKSKFDELIKLILENKEKDIIVDTGSTTYTPFSTYFVENELYDLFKNEGIDYTVIGIVMGGGNTVTSYKSLEKITNDIKCEKILLFNNQYTETVYNETEMEDSKTTKSIEDKTVAIIDIPTQSEYIFKNLNLFAKKKLIFSDLDASKDFDFMEKRRLKIYRDGIWKQLDQLEGK